MISEESVTLHIDEENVDALPSYADIWTKILSQDYLNLLTDQKTGQAPIRNIDYLNDPDWSA